MNNAVVRSQSPEAAKLLVHEEQVAQAEKASAQGQIVQAGGGTWTGDARTKGELRGLVQSNLNTNQVSHNGYHTPRAGYPSPAYANGAVSPHWRRGNFDAQPCPPGANCHPGAENAPPNHQEQVWDHGGRRHRGAYDYHTYSYKTPNNLSYPQQSQLGGAITYPYYTHKGPSDFFWKGD
ncbi:MAG: hypothetical protein JKY95_14865 [Planctomycetaceae bacterium]|nr:hypothetical protein [Planctomycetaceae bacterium]MBL4885798.1 hypothetical protein [Planctomycetaceae bacterium]